MDKDVRDWLDANYGKKVVAIYGNCHTTAIRHFLDQIDSFRDEYAIYPLMAIQDVKDPAYFENGIIQSCDLFIHQVIRDNNRYGVEWASRELLKKTKNGCQVIGIPNVYHLPICFFQQYSEKKDFCRKNNSTVFFRDKILDKAYLEKWSIQRTVEYYTNEDFKDYGTIENEFNLFIEKVSNREKDWDIKISDYIIDNYKICKLFYDPNHPTPAIIHEIAERLLELLGIRLEKKTNYIDFPLDSFEMPICGCVKRALGMDFSENELRKTGIKRTQGIMKLEDYIQEYWAYEWQNSEVNKFRRFANALKYFSAAMARRVK